MIVAGIVGLATEAKAVDYELNWAAPTTRLDGKPMPITEIGGYTLHYRKLSESKFYTIQIPNPSATTYTITGLADVPYKVTIAAYDTAKLYSTYVPFTLYKVAPGLPTNPCGITF